MDKQLIGESIDGLKGSVKELREREKALIKLSTLSEQIEKAQVAIGKEREDLLNERIKLAELESRKALSFTKSLSDLSAEVNQFLPGWNCTVKISGGDKLFIGAVPPGKEAVAPYKGLSGGEKVAFDMAFSTAFLNGSKNKVIIGECAEIDDRHLAQLMSALVDHAGDRQIILSTCHAPDEVAAQWNVIACGQ